MTKWKYTSEMTEWIRKNSNGVEWDDLAPQFNEMFGCDKTARQLRSHAHDNGIHNGILKQSPTKHGRPVGSKRLDKDGYVVVKIAKPCKWRREQFVIWEQYNEPIDIKKDILMHRDGNKQNNAIENLKKVSRSIIGIINKSGLSSQINKKTIDAIVAWAELKQGAINRIQKERRCSRGTARYYYDPARFIATSRRYYERKNNKK